MHHVADGRVNERLSGLAERLAREHLRELEPARDGAECGVDRRIVALVDLLHEIVPATDSPELIWIRADERA